MQFADNTSSYTIIDKRTDGQTDNYARLGQSIMVRKFDPAVVQPGNWTELWIGVRWHVSSSTYWMTSSFEGNPIDPLTEYSTFEIGLCNTAGPVWGQGGMIDASNQNTVGFRKSDFGLSGTTWWEMRTTGSGNNQQTLATGGGYTAQRITGSLLVYDVRRDFAISMNTGFYAGNNRSICIFRFFSPSGSVNDYLYMNILYPDKDKVKGYNDISSSTILADIMNSPSWAAAVTTASAIGYTTIIPPRPSMIPISQSRWGYLDGMFISWKRLYDSLDISDVVLKVI